MTNTIILVCGVQGSGKSWVCRQLAEKFDYVPHDQCWKHPIYKPKNQIDAKWGPPGSVSTHLETLVKRAKDADRTIITEVPFAEKQLKEDLEDHGLKVVPVFVVEDGKTISKRLFDREKKRPTRSVLTRAEGLAGRASRWGCFAGTSSEVLKHLKQETPVRKSPFVLHP